MAEFSAFWAGETLGDAAHASLQAPYTDIEYSMIYKRFFNSTDFGLFIIPEYGSELNIRATTPVSLAVQVQTGVADVNGRYYENTDNVNLSLATADATNPRIDRVILRIDVAAQTIRLAILTGTPAASPAPPATTNNATIQEFALGEVWIAALATTITNNDIHDTRVFAFNFFGATRSLDQGNLIANSEFMAFSALGTIPAAIGSVQPPDGWEMTGTVTSFASVTKPSFMSRGRGVRVTAGGVNAGLQRTIRVAPNTMYSFVGLMQVTAGDVGFYTITTNSGSPQTITRAVRRTGAWRTEQIFYRTESDATTMTISLGANNNTDVVDIGQCLLVQGFAPGNFRPISETIFFLHTIGDTNWNNTAKSSGLTTLDLDADFQTLVLPGTKALYMQIAASDSGSAAGTAALSVRHKGGTVSQINLALNSETNSAQRWLTGWVAVDNATNAFDANVVATGAGAMLATLRINGINI